MIHVNKLDLSNRQGGIFPPFQFSRNPRQTMHMARPIQIDDIRASLQRIMDNKGVKPTTLSLAVSNSRSLVKDILEKTENPGIVTLSKLAEELDCSLEDLISSGSQLHYSQLGPTLYVKGKVAAGEWVEAFEYPEGDWKTYTGRAGVRADRKHRFGLLVTGDSMDELYPEGTIIDCVSVFGHTEIENGKKVVVLRKRRDQTVEATVKEYAVVDGKKWLRPRSKNPIHQSIDISSPDPDIEETRVIAIVVGAYSEE